MKMLSIWKAITFLALSKSMLLPCTTKADTNEVVGSVCSGSDNATMANQYYANLNTLMDSLAANAPKKDGFQTAAVSGTIYGLMQCRGDVSVVDCANCINNLTTVTNCTSSQNATIWLTWCFVRYSNVSFFGIWDQSGMAVANDSDYDNQNVVSQGLNFMNELASTAPKQPLMFQVAVLDVGVYGKRFGMAQCTRDISRRDCGKCLYYQLTTFRTTVGNKRAWKIYGSSCSMRYHDFQFYFNFSLPANEGFTSFPSDQVIMGLIVTMLLYTLVL